MGRRIISHQILIIKRISKWAYYWERFDQGNRVKKLFFNSQVQIGSLFFFFHKNFEPKPVSTISCNLSKCILEDKFSNDLMSEHMNLTNLEYKHERKKEKHVRQQSLTFFTFYPLFQLVFVFWLIPKETLYLYSSIN